VENSALIMAPINYTVSQRHFSLSAYENESTYEACQKFLKNSVLSLMYMYVCMYDLCMSALTKDKSQTIVCSFVCPQIIKVRADRSRQRSATCLLY